MFITAVNLLLLPVITGRNVINHRADARLQGETVNDVCNSPDFPIHMDHVNIIAEKLEPGLAVAMRPVNTGVKKLITESEELEGPNELMISGKGFLAEGKSSNLNFLAGKVAVDPRLSKKGTALTSEDQSKMEGEYHKNLDLYPVAHIGKLEQLKEDEETKRMCGKQGRLIIVEGGKDEEPFDAYTLLEGISFEQTPRSEAK